MRQICKDRSATAGDERAVAKFGKGGLEVTFMCIRAIRLVLFVAVCAALLLPGASGQSVSGQIAGVVTDSQRLAVATVQLTNSLSSQVREFQTDAGGAFIFANIITGIYHLPITQPGFRTYNQSGIRVEVQERGDLHTIILAVGDVATAVDVVAEAAHVATDRSDRAISRNTRQVGDFTSRACGRRRNGRAVI